MPRLYVLVLSGGAGTRLWPLSRRDRPKQFLNLLGDRSLLQDTVDRVSEFVPNERIFVVAPPEPPNVILTCNGHRSDQVGISLPSHWMAFSLR